jgi:hypothetical protein
MEHRYVLDLDGRRWRLKQLGALDSIQTQMDADKTDADGRR